MRIIDSHVHLYPPEVNADPVGWARRQGELHWAKLCTRVRKNGVGVQSFPSVDEFLSQMDDDGVERVVLLGWYWENAESAEQQNSFFAQCVQAHSERISACATWHPTLAPEPFLQAVKAAGFVGVGELSPHSQGGLGSVEKRERWAEFFAGAGRHGLPVNLHVTEPEGGDYLGKVPTPFEDVVGWAERFPETTFIWAHWGARLPLREGWVERVRKLSNVLYDTAASPLIYRDPKIWREMLDAVGSERVLFGSDFPLVLFPRDEGAKAEFAGLVSEARSVSAGLSQDECRAILAENAAKIWRIGGLGNFSLERNRTDKR